MRVYPIIPALLIFASPAFCDESLQTRRAAFQQLLPIAQSGRLDEHRAALAELEDYPLYPYLQAADLTWRLRHTDDPKLDTRIRDFIAAYPRLAAANTLRQRWVRDLAERERWPLVLANIQDSDGAALQCHAMTARIRTGAASDQALAERALAFWRVGRSQPDACDPVFEWLAAEDALPDREILGRARLAIQARKYGLARYLSRQLPETQAQRVQRWLEIVQNPGELHHVQGLDGDVAVAAFKNLALQDLPGAASLLPELAERLDLSPGERHAMQRYVALLYAQDHQPQALVWFQRLQPERLDDFSRAWRIRSALYHRRWEQALGWIDSLPPDQADEEEWRYWRGRALTALDREEEARAALAELAQERSYHGYLAADALARSYRLNERPLKHDPAIRGDLLRRPGILRARELHALEMYGAARAEWAAATDGLSPAQLRQAALLAHDWGWHDRAIITLVHSDYWDDLNIRYPLPYDDAITSAARDSGLERAYILAIMRTESLFIPDVQSPAGARGLMQLMPGTARRVARTVNRPAPGGRDLYVPEINIQLGSRYLSAMLERFGEHPALANAAYNAGPHRVERWLPERTTPADLWIANIPYTETREYVQRSMSHLVAFQHRLGQKIVPLRKRLPAIPGEQ